jgi:hypothetical protein
VSGHVCSNFSVKTTIYEAPRYVILSILLFFSVCTLFQNIFSLCSYSGRNAVINVIKEKLKGKAIPVTGREDP